MSKEKARRNFILERKRIVPNEGPCLKRQAFRCSSVKSLRVCDYQNLTFFFVVFLCHEPTCEKDIRCLKMLIDQSNIQLIFNQLTQTSYTLYTYNFFLKDIIHKHVLYWPHIAYDLQFLMYINKHISLYKVKQINTCVLYDIIT